MGNCKRMIYLGSVGLGQLAGIYGSLLTDLFGVYFGVSGKSFREKKETARKVLMMKTEAHGVY